MMKNCETALFGLLVRAIERTPAVWFFFVGELRVDGVARAAGAVAARVAAWIMKPGISAVEGRAVVEAASPA